VGRLISTLELVSTPALYLLIDWKFRAFGLGNLSHWQNTKPQRLQFRSRTPWRNPNMSFKFLSGGPLQFGCLCPPGPWSHSVSDSTSYIHNIHMYKISPVRHKQPSLGSFVAPDNQYQRSARQLLSIFRYSKASQTLTGMGTRARDHPSSHISTTHRIYTDRDF